MPYILTGNRGPRFGSVDQELLRDVLESIESGLAAANQLINGKTKAKLTALVYQTACEDGQVDPLVVQKAIDLLS